MEFSGIIHVHSTYSYDGEVSLAELRALCERDGIRFVCLAEHIEGLSEERKQVFINECRERSDSAFLFIPGFEVPHTNTHILKLGDALEVIAHPHRSGFSFFPCSGVEVWNSQYDGKRFPRWAALRWFRKLLRAHPELHAYAGVDLHRRSHLKGPRVVIDADALTEEHVLDAMRAGHYRLVSDACEIDSRGRILRPSSIAVFFGSMFDICRIRFVRFMSSIVKHLGLYRFSWFRHMRERIRTKF